MDNNTKELIGMLIVFTIVIAGVQWFLVRFTHWSVALTATGIIAFVVSFLYVSLKHATPNGGSNGPGDSEYIMSMLVLFGSLLCGLALVCYLTQNHLPKMVFLLPLTLIIVFAAGKYVYNYIDSATFYYTHFSSCEIELLDKTGGTSIVEQISFRNPSSGFTTNINLNFNEKPYPNIIRFADKIIFRNYSPKPEQSFIKEFPFDYSLLKEKKGVRIGFLFWLYQKIALPMKIVLKPNNSVDLYIDNHLVKQYQLMTRIYQKNSLTTWIQN